MRSGRAGPCAQPGKLPRATGGTTRRTVTTQRARTHPQARGQRRRYVVQRRAAVAANFHSGRARAQPVASRRAFRIDALHSPTGQVLHFFPLLFRHAPSRARTRFPIRLPCLLRTGNSSGKVARILRFVSCGVKRKDTIPSGTVAERNGENDLPPPPNRSALPRSINPRQKSVRPLQPFLACPQSVLPVCGRWANSGPVHKEIPIRVSTGGGGEQISNAKTPWNMFGCAAADRRGIFLARATNVPGGGRTGQTRGAGAAIHGRRRSGGSSAPCASLLGPRKRFAIRRRRRRTGS